MRQPNVKRPFYLPVVVFFSLLILLAACGESPAPLSLTPTPQYTWTTIVPVRRLTPTPRVFVPSPTPADGIPRVMVGGNYFEPIAVKVRKGTTIEWVHEGAAAHNVTSINSSWPSIPMDFGRRYRMVFDKPGTYTYICTLHAGMSGLIEVTD